MKKRKTLAWVSGHKTPDKTYITRVFNFGTFEEWKAMRRKFSERAILETVKHPLRGQWNRRGRAFAEALFHIRMPKNVLISYDA